MNPITRAEIMAVDDVAPAWLGLPGDDEVYWAPYVTGTYTGPFEMVLPLFRSPADAEAFANPSVGLRFWYASALTLKQAVTEAREMRLRCVRILEREGSEWVAVRTISVGGGE